MIIATSNAARSFSFHHLLKTAMPPLKIIRAVNESD